MPAQTRLTKLTAATLQGLVLIFWLVLVMGCFYPWENYVNPQGDALGDMQVQGFGTSHAVYMILFSCISLLALLRWKSVAGTLWLAWPVVILCAWILLSVRWGPNPAISLNRAGRFLIVVVLSAYVASRYDSRQSIGLLTKGFAILVLLSLAVMVLVPSLGYSHLGGGYQGAWRGAFTHKNWLGSAMSLGVIVTGYSYLVRVNHRLLSGATFLGCLFLLMMSRSATAILATFASVLVALVGAAVQSRRAPVLRAFALIGLGATVVFFIMLPLGPFAAYFDDLPLLAGRSSDLTGRTDVWRAVWAAIRDRPFIGYGYGFWDQPSVMRSNIWLAVNWTAPHAHNNWLDAALQLGLVGVVLAAVIWLTALRRALWLVIVRHGQGALFYFTILFACLLESMVETVMFAPVLGALFWLVTSYIYIARIARQRAAAARSIPRVPEGSGASPAYLTDGPRVIRAIH